MKNRNLKKFNYTVSTIDLNFNYIKISDVKTPHDLFKSVKEILTQFNNNKETFSLNIDPLEHETVKCKYIDEDLEYYKPKSGYIQILQMNISKKGAIEVSLDPSAGEVLFHTFRIGSQKLIDKISQNQKEIQIEYDEFGRPNEEILEFIIENSDGSLTLDKVDAFFAYDDEMTEEQQELDKNLGEITKKWYELIENIS